MESNSSKWLGIDVSKSELVTAYRLAADKWVIKTYANTESGIASLVRDLCGFSQKFRVVLEATGMYSMKVVFGCCQAGIRVSVLNPKQSKGFIQGVLLSTTKTDAQDACALALYGEVNTPKAYKLPDDKLLKIRQLRVFLKQLKKHLRSISNQLHALSFHVEALEFVRARLEQNKALIELQIRETEAALQEYTKDCFDQAYKLACSVIGIGPSIAQALLVATNALQSFDNAKQLAKYIGVCPTQYESGSSIQRRGGIAKTGDPNIRSLLYMGARSAKRFNPPCKMLYDRLRNKGKCHKVAMLAVCNKMIHQVFAVVKKQNPFDPNYHQNTSES